MARRDGRDAFTRLWETASAQGGYFTTCEAHRAGYSNRLLTYHAQKGDWDRIERSIYRLRNFPPGPSEDLIRWTLWSGGKAVVSHETAVAVYDLGDLLPSRIHLTVPKAFRKVHPSVVLHRADLSGGDVEEAHGFRVTNPLRTILDCVRAGLDDDALIAIVRDALRKGVCSRRALESRLGELPRGAADRLRNVLLAAGEGS